MKVSFFVSSLMNMPSRRVRDIAVSAWKNKREDDELRSFLVLEAASRVNDSGMKDVYKGKEYFLTSCAVSQRRAWVKGNEIVIDYTLDALGVNDVDVYRDSDAENIEETHGIRVSSAYVGRDIMRAYHQGYTDISVLVPPHMACDDMGLGMFAQLYVYALSGGDTFGEGAEGVASDIELARECAAWVESASYEQIYERLRMVRQLFAGIRLRVYTAHPQRLLGFSGVARGFESVDAYLAQNMEKRNSLWVSRIEKAFEESQSSLIGIPTDFRDPYAGGGSGIAYILACVGAFSFSFVDFMYRCYEIELEDTDLIIYITSHIGVDLPLMLTHISEQEIISPIVLVSDISGMHKSELPNLNLAGTYELRPEHAFISKTTEDILLESDELEEKLYSVIQKIAHTWGWDSSMFT
ncbi:MAG: hypothetical protein J6M18_04530 [Actinomycetaceae bacterium]|nr:hypothetical protein [Actinomycetaceae bacterium]